MCVYSFTNLKSLMLGVMERYVRFVEEFHSKEFTFSITALLSQIMLVVVYVCGCLLYSLHVRECPSHRSGLL